ncbi:MAG: ANTAR domain-containing protein [Actinophytocola sp.]|uniref:GAF and ANTAR domain-containing protein n=1 Tax=Actinophytocola sp. TaxID=1872138 RepID=UPI00132B30C1|nr:GAF and ANTAR domain-containing protein [Actinophytocola sp.]MPZ86029.1 ANTAR domain-containing protein [Actinophytocola sp.]
MAEGIRTLARELAEVTRLVEADDFGSTLDRFAARIVRTIPGCDAATITVRSATAVETVAGGKDLGFDPLTPGPVVEAVTFAEPRRLEDVTTDQRWPAFGGHLINGGFRGCLALPLVTHGSDTAVLTLFSRETGQFDELAYDVVLLLTLNAGVAFDNASLYHDSHELVAQLRTALQTRSVVGRAQGLLMRHFDCDSEQAFTALKRASQNSNTKLRDLAPLVVEAHESGDFDAELAKLALNPVGEPRS